MSNKLLLYSILASGAYLVLVTVGLELVGRAIGVARRVPRELTQPVGSGWLVMNFILEFLFFVVIPALAYTIFASMLPLTGIRTGLSIALAGFGLGALPAILGLSIRLELPMAYLLYYLCGILLKLGGSLAIIGYLHSL